MRGRSIVNALCGRNPKSKPTLTTISSISTRVFIKAPRAQDSAGLNPPDPAGPIQRKHLAEYGRKPAEDREDSELVRAIENRAAAIAVTPAKRIQPTTSLTAADVIAITPIRVRASPYWRRIRPRIGTAVIARPTPTNRLYTEGLIAGASAGADQCPIMRPSTKGTLTGAIATARARRACISRVRPQ